MKEYKTAEDVRAAGRERQTAFRKNHRRIELQFSTAKDSDVISYLTSQNKKPADLIAELIREKIEADSKRTETN